MLNSKTTIFKIIFVGLFLTSCASGTKKGFSDSSGYKPSSSQAIKLQSPLSKDQALIQELTGKPVTRLPSQQELKSKPLSTQHYYAGLRAAENKKYILAIKHFNTVLKKYPHSNEVKLAFVSKAKVYKEMGLLEPATLNMRMAQNTKVKVLKRKTASAGKTTANK